VTAATTGVLERLARRVIVARHSTVEAQQRESYLAGGRANIDAHGVRSGDDIADVRGGCGILGRTDSLTDEIGAAVRQNRMTTTSARTRRELRP